MDRLGRKIEETLALQIARRDRSTAYDRMGLSSRGTSDRFVEAQIVEQPAPAGPAAPGADPGGQDVIVPPESPAGTAAGPVQPPEGVVAPEEEPADVEEPETDVDEERKRALFNTLSELIDLGRIGRNEQELRKYVDEHEDEFGELMEVLEDVLDMLIGTGAMFRQPKTFDVGDQEQPKLSPFAETKPGVGGQVPQGGTTTTIIASDQSRPAGDALHEAIVDQVTRGGDVDAALGRAAEDLREETLELEFRSPGDLDRAVKAIDRSGIASTNVLKAGPTTMNVVRDERNKEDVERQLAAIRAEGVEFEQPEAVAAEDAAALAAGPNVGVGASAVRGEDVDEAMKTRALDPRERGKECPHRDEGTGVTFGRWMGRIPNTGKYACSMCGTELDPGTGKAVAESTVMELSLTGDWYVVWNTERGPQAQPAGDKSAARRSVELMNANNPSAGARLVRASGPRQAITTYARRAGLGRMTPEKQARSEQRRGFLKGVAKAAATPWTFPVKSAWGLYKAATGKPAAKADAPAGKGPGLASKVWGAIKPLPMGDTPEQKAQAQGLQQQGAEKIGGGPAMKSKPAAPAAKPAAPAAKPAPGVPAAKPTAPAVGAPAAKVAPKGVAKKRKVPVEVGEGYQRWSDPTMKTRKAMGEGFQVTWRADDAESAESFASLKEAEARVKDLRDLGYKGVVLEQINVTRTGMAVEVVFGDKGIAAASKGALLQYKGIDTVQDVGDGTLVVFTTDTDAEEARNRVTTILQNARVPMEGFRCARYRPAILEANPGGQSAVGGSVPGISRSYNGPDAMPAPMPATAGGKGSSLEAADDSGVVARWESSGGKNWLELRKDKTGYSYRGNQSGGNLGDISTGDAMREMMKRVAAMGVSMRQVEQAGAQDPADKERYMRPFYAADEPEGGDEGLGLKAVPEPGDPDYSAPEYDEEPAGKPEAGLESTIWRMDVPEDPAELDRLTAALNRAKEAGVVASWTEVGKPEEEPPELEPAGDLSIAAPGMNAPVPVEPPSAASSAAGTAPPPPRPHGAASEAVVDQPPMGGPSGMDDVPAGAADQPLAGLGGIEGPEGLEEPEEEEHYIAVEFAAETELEERERFPDWIADETADPETGEGGVLIAGWKPGEEGEEMPGEPGEEISGEIPGMSPETPPESFGDSIPTADALADEVAVPEERILGEDVRHMCSIYAAVKEATRRGDGPNRMRFAEALVRHGHARGISRAAMARLLREDEAALEQVYYDPGEEQVGRHQIKHFTKGIQAPKIPWGEPAAPKVPADLEPTVHDYKAARKAGDEATATRIYNELRFQLQARGIDVDQALAEQGGDGDPCPTPGRKIRSGGQGRGLARGAGRGPMGVPAGGETEKK